VRTPGTRLEQRNIALLMTDLALFGCGFAFLGTTTVLPSLVSDLGGGPMAVGLLGAVQTAGWLLPQLVAGRFTAHRVRVKGYVVLPLALSRLFLALLVPILLFVTPRSPNATLVALLTCIGGFCVLDAVAGVGWFELISKAVPVERRGRVFGWAQSLGNAGGFVAGLAISAILARPAPFPQNQALLIGLAALLTFLSLMATANIAEPPGAVVQDEPRLPWRQFLARTAAILRWDRCFAWLTGVRLLSGLSDMAAGFYIIYATRHLGLPVQMTGWSVSAGVVGGVLGGVLLGRHAAHRGHDAAITVLVILRCLAPALALAAPLASRLHPWAAIVLFLLLFCAMGMVNGAWIVGFNSYAMEIAPPGERSVYVGLANTLSGMLAVAPLLAGWLVQAVSYEAVFLVSLALAATALAVTRRAPARQRIVHS